MKPATLRQRFLVAVCLAVLAGVSAVCAATPNLRLENDHYLVEVRQPNGIIARIRSSFPAAN